MSAGFSFSYFSSCYFCLLLVVALFHLCLSKKNFDDVLCMGHERQALLQFKHGLIDEADRLASWDNEKNDCCRWAGIVCDNFTGHVQRIHLPGLDGHCDYYGAIEDKEKEEDEKQRLRGDLSPSLLYLKQLKHLDLSCNDFGGIQVPSFLGYLGNLRYLNLSRSRFGGIIPPQLGNLSELHVLSLGNFYNDVVFQSGLASIRNMQWLSSLRLLHHLDMSVVDLSKAINWFQVINTLPSLVELHLSDCQLSHIHPHVASLNVTSLSILDLSYNNFSNSSVPRWIFSITSLVSLDLSRCNFYGPIPSSVDSFHNLTSLELLHVPGNDFMDSSLVLKGLSSVSSNLISLDISFCGVSSSILSALHNLSSLCSLRLSGNQLTKPIAKSLGDLCNLRHIDLASNYFADITLTSLLQCFFKCKSPSLESLGLSYNLISGPIPYSIGRLSSLEELDLWHNRLNGSLPDSLGQLSKLNSLDLPDNFLTGVVTEAHFAKLARLKRLDGQGNNLTLRLRHANWIPPFQLQYLSLSSWDLGPQFPLWLQHQRDLRVLVITNTTISSTMPPMSFWRSLPELRYLYMSQNHIHGRLFGIPATLRVLDLSSNEFSGQLPELPNGSFTNVLDLSHNSFVGSLRQLLCPNGGKYLDVLNLEDNHLSGVIPECWVKWPSLFVLNLENNNLSGGLPRTLGSLSSLVSLNIRENNLDGRIPTWLGRELSSLRILDLRSNNLDGNIPHELCYLTSIHVLDIAHNNLSGNIPRCFNNFSLLSQKEATSNGSIYFSATLVTKGREDIYSYILRLVKLLDFSSNNFSGHIPRELMALHALQSLNLSINQLTGRIPENIGDLKLLESFDVSLNQLSGELPVSLGSLSFLSSFNVSYNKLTGRVPSSTQLQGFNESCFFGNKLCGDPLTTQCRVEVPRRDQEEDVGSRGADWGLIISIVLGFIAGFWVVVAPLMVSTTWRIAYFRFCSDLRYMFCDCIRKYSCYIFPK